MFDEAYICINCVWMITVDPAKNKTSRVAFCHGDFIPTFPKAWEVSIKFWLPLFLCIRSMSAFGLWWHWLSQTITGSLEDPLTFMCCSHNFQGELQGQRMEAVRIMLAQPLCKVLLHTVVLYKCFHPVAESPSHSGCHSLHHTTPELHPASTLK